jgi:hypothetical protein
MVIISKQTYAYSLKDTDVSAIARSQYDVTEREQAVKFCLQSE